MSVSKNHSFEKIRIIYPAKSVVETCRHCGQRRLRYASGASVLIDAKGNPMRSDCTRGSKAPVIDINPKEKFKQVVGKVGLEFMPLMDLKARFKDCLIMLHLCFEELQDGKTREMVRRYLNSNQYEQTKKVVTA